MNKLTFKSLALMAVSVSLFSCADLSLDNQDEPDSSQIYSSASDMTNVASDLYRGYYMGVTNFDGSIALNVTADASTMSWGNFGSRDVSYEPRNAYNNDPNYSSSDVNTDVFEDLYSNISTARAIITQMDGGVDFGEDETKVRAWLKFNQGIALGYIALLYDKAFIVDENTTDEFIGAPTYSTYSEIAAVAIQKLDEAIALADANTFSYPDGWILGVSVDNVLLSQLANSYAARILSGMPRNATENAAVNWDAVLGYANNGITADFNVLQDDINWYNLYITYLIYPGWGRTDNYVVNMMDPTYPAHQNDGIDRPAPDSANAVDMRIFSDFEYLGSNNFREDRGFYHFSNFRFSRQDTYIDTWDTELPELMLAENEMYKAEAYMHKGDLTNAAAIINAGTRVTRGQMAPVAENAAAIKTAIHHERQIEMHLTGVGLQFFEMRKNDLLQLGTFLHFPVPASVLQVQGETSFYSFGGEANADGIGTSDGGWNQ